MVFAFWILVIVGSIGTVRSVVGLLIIVSLMRVVGPDTAMPTLVVNAGLLAVAVAQIGCGLSLRRGRRWPRTVVTVLPGVSFLVFALTAMPAMLAYPMSIPAILLGFLVSPDGLGLVGGTAAAVSLWRPSAGPFFRRADEP